MKRSSFGNCRRWKISMRSRANFSASSVVGVAGLHRGIDFGRGDAQAAGVEIEPVEFPRRLDQRRIAARRHVVDDGAGRRARYRPRPRAWSREMRRIAGRNRRWLRSRRTGMMAFRSWVRRGSLLNGAAANRPSTLAIRLVIPGSRRDGPIRSGALPVRCGMRPE